MPCVQTHGISYKYWPQTLVVHMSFSTLAAEAASGVKKSLFRAARFCFGCQLKQKPHHSGLGSLLVEKPPGSSELVI